jgi:murein DD-endopeptidase MepM/ murein hydrolase activator NlpD
VNSTADSTSVEVTLRPARPMQGTVAAITVRPADGATIVDGTLAGEPLHFERDTSGAWRALAGIPIDAAETMRLTLVVARYSSRADTVAQALEVAKGTYEMRRERGPERLNVATRFSTPPDSALQARMADEARRARAVAERAHETPRLWREPWVRPRPGRVTSAYGNGRMFNGVVQSRHMGTDFAGAAGTPVRAANRGVVALVGDFFLGGNVVYVDHGAGLTTAYLHLSSVEVAEGDTVVRGQLLGRVGATGRVTGPHLHWIVRYGGITVDPMSLLALEGAKPVAEAAAQRTAKPEANATATPVAEPAAKPDSLPTPTPAITSPR